MLGEKVVQGLYDYAAADIEMAGQDLNFKKGDYMVVISEYVGSSSTILLSNIADCR